MVAALTAEEDVVEVEEVGLEEAEVAVEVLAEDVEGSVEDVEVLTEAMTKDHQKVLLVCHILSIVKFFIDLV